MTKINQLWTEKYRPLNLYDYIWQNLSHKTDFTHYVDQGEIPNLIFCGLPGAGKSCLSNLLVSKLIPYENRSTDLMKINASDENSVEIIREKISTFVQSFSIGKFKIIQLEECDYLTPNAQAILRTLIEDNSDHCRFIGTCNQPNKIMPALHSRFTRYNFKAPGKEEIIVHAANILLEEEIAIETDEDVRKLETYIDETYPDIRSLLLSLQKSCKGGKISSPAKETYNTHKKNIILKLMAKSDFRGLGEFVSELETDEYRDIFNFITKNLQKVPKFLERDKEESAILIIAEYLYKHSLVACPDINLKAMFIRLDRV